MTPEGLAWTVMLGIAFWGCVAAPVVILSVRSMKRRIDEIERMARDLLAETRARHNGGYDGRR